MKTESYEVELFCPCEAQGVFLSRGQRPSAVSVSCARDTVLNAFVPASDTFLVRGIRLSGALGHAVRATLQFSTAGEPTVQAETSEGFIRFDPPVLFEPLAYAQLRLRCVPEPGHHGEVAITVSFVGTLRSPL